MRRLWPQRDGRRSSRQGADAAPTGVTDADEALARGADQQRQPERLQFIEPGQRRHALFRRLAEADAGVEHDIAEAKYRPSRAISSERAKKAAISFMMSMLASTLSRLCMTMTGALRAADQPGHAGIALQAPDVVGDRGAMHQAPRRRRPISCCRSRRERRAQPRPASTGCNRFSSSSAEIGSEP